MEIPDIKEQLSILTILNHYRLTPGRHEMIPCPFHEEKTPSLKIYPGTNTFHCFGCGTAGDQIEFIQRMEKITKHEAIMKAQELIAPREMMQVPQVVKGPEGLTTEERLRILNRIFESFRNGLNSPVSRRPKEYLEKRKLDYTSLEIGYNSGQFHHHGKLSPQDERACVEAGLLIPYNGHTPHGRGISYTPFARDCVIFPLKDSDGRVVSLYGRSINPENSNGTGKHYYLKNRQGLYPCYPDPGTSSLILTEAVIDAATLMQFPEITTRYTILACYGVNGLTQEHQEAINALHQLKEIIFFFDGDKAGIEAVHHNAQTIHKLLPSVKLTTVDTPENEDINSLLQGHTPEIFPHLLKSRRDLFYLNEESSVKEKNDTDRTQTTGTLNTRNPEFITYTTDELQIIILGGINLTQSDRLRVTLKISRAGSPDPLHSIRHTLDLYHSDYLDRFIQKAGEQLEMGTNTLKRALSGMTDEIERYRLSRIESMKEEKPRERQLTEERYKKALRYLKAPGLMRRTNEDIGGTGVVGEEINRLLMYLVFTSRLREQPLHIISLGSSGTGKTYLQEKISELIPENDKLEITILSENAFYYFDRRELKHKLVLIEDMDGAMDVLYPLRELQTKRKISKTIPIKDSKGNLKTITLQVEGPISLAGTTTRERLYEDNANRSLLIYLDNSASHREMVMEYQRRLSAGKIDTCGENKLKEFFRDMQSVLKPVSVRNPFAEYLKLPDHVFKPLRTNAHYLAFIETVTFYHQWQRELKTDPATGEQFVETTLEDIQWANRLLKDVLLAKSDELSGECRGFFERLKKWIKEERRTSFFACQARESFRMNPSNLKYYLVQLVRYGYIKPVGGDRYKRGYEYEVTNFDDYTELKDSINNVFDQVLEKIKSSMGGQRGQQVDNRTNYPLKEVNTSEFTPVDSFT